MGVRVRLTLLARAAYLQLKLAWERKAEVHTGCLHVYSHSSFLCGYFPSEGGGLVEFLSILEDYILREMCVIN